MEQKRQKTEAAEFFTAKNVVRSMYDVAILKADILSGDYRKPEYQLFSLECGFGVHPKRMGNACYGQFCADGEECRMGKYDFLGIADEATTKYAEELEAKWKKAV